MSPLKLAWPLPCYTNCCPLSKSGWGHRGRGMYRCCHRSILLSSMHHIWRRTRGVFGLFVCVYCISWCKQICLAHVSLLFVGVSQPPKKSVAADLGNSTLFSMIFSRWRHHFASVPEIQLSFRHVSSWMFAISSTAATTFHLIQLGSVLCLINVN